MTLLLLFAKNFTSLKMHKRKDIILLKHTKLPLVKIDGKLYNVICIFIKY